MFSMGQAATEAGVSKSTLSRAIKIGRLSALRNDQGGYSIDPAELFRVYPRNGATRTGNGSMTQDATAEAKPLEPRATPAMAIENASLKAEVEGLRAMLQHMRDQADDLKRQRDGWEDQAKVALNRVLVVEDMRQRPPTTPTRRGLFGFLMRARTAA